MGHGRSAPGRRPGPAGTRALPTPGTAPASGILTASALSSVNEDRIPPAKRECFGLTLTPIGGASFDEARNDQMSVWEKGSYHAIRSEKIPPQC